MDIATYLNPILAPDHCMYSDHAAAWDYGRYNVARMERDAADASGVSYYQIIDSAGCEMLPADWREAILTARQHNRALNEQQHNAEVGEATDLMSSDIEDWSIETWKRLRKIGYAEFHATEASADGALWNAAYSLSNRGEELLREIR